MKKVYRVFQPYTGVYTDADTLEQTPTILAQAAWDAYLTLTHNSPVTEITINADGTQTWRNLDGTLLPNYDELKQLIEQSLNQESSTEN
jgi:hypothetical protein